MTATTPNSTIRQIVPLLIAFIGLQAYCAVITIGPGTGIGGSQDTPGGERLNTDRGSAALPAGTHDVSDFRLNVFDAAAGAGSAGTVTPMLLSGTPSSYTTLWVGTPFDPTSNGAQTAATYAPGAQTFTLPGVTNIFAGIFTGNSGSGVPAFAGGGSTDHDSSFTAPSGSGETVDGFSNPGLGRQYAFDITVDAAAAPVANAADADIASSGTDLLQTHLASVANSGVGGGPNADGPDGPESILRDGVAVDDADYNDGLNAARITNGDSVTYLLDILYSPGGYRIDQIDLFHGWRDGGRDRISDFDLAFSFIDAPNTFYDQMLGIDSGNFASDYGRTGIAPVAGNLGIGVAGVRFTFNNIENGYGGISEIDVFGAPVPEPSTWAIFGLCLVGCGFMLRRRQAVK